MASQSPISPLQALSAEVLSIVVGEAEKRLDAQLNVANAADQRALTFAGFTVATATASAAGAAALLLSGSVGLPLMRSALLLTFGLIVSAGLAMYAVCSKQFCLPGQRPINWTPDNWEFSELQKSKESALLEQCHALELSIRENAQHSKDVGFLFNASMAVALLSLIAALLLSAKFVMSEIKHPTIISSSTMQC